MKKTAFVLFLLASALLTLAAPAKADTTCNTALVSGSGPNYMKICISNDGNVVGFQSPSGYEHIAIGVIGEGYAVCTTIGGEIATNHGYDVGFAESGWGPATVYQPNGANSLPLTITRTTTDNTFTLKQSFSRNPGTKEVTVTMTLTNISGVAQPAVQLFREVDFDVDNTSSPNIFSKTLDTVSAEFSGTNYAGGASDGNGHGIQITAQTLAVSHTMYVQTFSNWYNSGNGDFQGCGPNFIALTPTAGQAGAGAPGDYMGWLIYNFGNMNAGIAKTVAVTYRRF